MTIIGTMTGTLRINLRMKTEASRGLRLWIARQLVSCAAVMLGGKLLVDLEPEMTMDYGNGEKQTVKL